MQCTSTSNEEGVKGLLLLGLPLALKNGIANVSTLSKSAGFQTAFGREETLHT